MLAGEPFSGATEPSINLIQNQQNLVLVAETPQQRQALAQFDLAKCQELEPSLYRCPGIDAPLCNPDFERNSVQCVKITKDGVLLQQFPSDAM